MQVHLIIPSGDCKRKVLNSIKSSPASEAIEAADAQRAYFIRSVSLPESKFHYRRFADPTYRH